MGLHEPGTAIGKRGLGCGGHSADAAAAVASQMSQQAAG
jgi:hypothetical protein